MKTGKMLLFVAIGLCGQEKEKIIITNPFRTDAYAAILEVSPLPKFTFSLNKTLRIRKTDKAAMYEYKPKKPDKPYRHLAIFMELLVLETKKQLPRTDVVVVAREEFHEISEVDGIAWSEPLVDSSVKPRGAGLLWFTEGGIFKIFLVNLKSSEGVLTLEQFLAHLALMSEWESGVINVSPEDTEVLVDKRKEEWKKREGKASILFHRISGHWKLLQLNWPPLLTQRPKIFSVPLPWPPWPLPRKKSAK